MNVNTAYGVSAAVSYAPPSPGAALQAQASSLMQQIESTSKDGKLDCNAKEAKLGQLHAQLERTEGQLQQLQAKARSSLPSTDTEVKDSSSQPSKDLETKVRLSIHPAELQSDASPPRDASQQRDENQLQSARPTTEPSHRSVDIYV